MEAADGAAPAPAPSEGPKKEAVVDAYGRLKGVQVSPPASRPAEKGRSGLCRS